MLRARVNELESEMARRNEVHAKEKKKFIQTITDLRKETQDQNKQIKRLKSLRIKYNGPAVSLEEYDSHIKQEAAKVTNEEIEKKANLLAEKMLPELVAIEINSYPHSCSIATKKKIEQVVDSIIGTRLGSFIHTIFGGSHQRL